jgi:hypothetical protein
MLARRRWAPVVASTTDRARALGGSVRLRSKTGFHNNGYRSSTADLDRVPSRTGFSCVEEWRESMRVDPAVRAALLNPLDYEP